MISLSQIKILPMMILVAFFAFSVRLLDVASSGIPDFSTSTAYAKAKNEKPKQELSEEKGAHDADESIEEIQATKDNDYQEDKSQEKALAGAKWRDANDSDLGYTKIKTEFFNELAMRNKALDTREKELHTKEAMLQAAELELRRKYQEMEKLRQQIENLLEEQSEAEKKQIESLVKIYEGMKPKSAASIFNTLDLDVLVSVLSNMSERKLSPILALMNPERARTVTIILAQQKKLPELPR